MHVAVRADGGADIGYGHLVRTSALTEGVLSMGGTATVATTTPESAREVYPEACSIVAVPSRDNPDPFLGRMIECDPDVVVTDAYPVDTTYQRTVRERYPLVVIQDDSRHTVCADALVNGHLYAPSLDYDYVAVEPRWCLGPEYVLLRRSITNLVSEDPEFRDRPEHLVVTIGGSDPAGTTPQVLNAIGGLNVTVTVVVGPGFTNVARINDAASESNTPVETLRDPDPTMLARLFFEADMAVCGCGTTVYELLALGTPFVGIVQADNQRLVAEELEDRNLATTLPMNATIEDIRSAVTTLYRDRDRRRDVQRRGRALVDGKGRHRVSKILETIVI